MKAPAAFQGDFTDLKFIKSRRVAQVIIEINLEEAAAFIAAFGAPNPAEGVPVALARLVKTANDEPAPVKQRRKWEDMDPSTQCAIRCGEPAFRQFLFETGGLTVKDDVAQSIRNALGIPSRSDLNTNAMALKRWADIEGKYQFWLRVPV